VARFYCTTDNSRGNTVSAMGNKHGQGAHIRGWSAGVRVHAHPDYTDKDVDVFDIYATTGSGGNGREVKIGTVRQTSDGPIFVPAEARVSS
jgi:hypothetical protein